MRVALVNPPTLFSMTENPPVHTEMTPYYELLTADEDRSAEQSTMPGEHLGLGMLASSLRISGHEAVIVNGCARFDRSLAATARAIMEAEPDLVGFSGPVEVFGEIRSLSLELRSRGFDGPIAVGHDFATLNAREVLEAAPELDLVVHGEGERSLVEVASALDEGRPYDDIAGVTRRVAGGIATRPPATPLDIGELPLPARDDTQVVLEHGMAVRMFTGRGCPYRCSFCTSGSLASSLGTTSRAYVRRKPPEDAARELIELSGAFGCQHVTIVDDLFLTGSRQSSEWAKAFASSLIDARSRTEFMIDCRVDTLDEDVLGLLKRAGLSKVFVGVESGSNQQRRNLLNKHYGATEVAEAFDVLRRLGLHTVIGFIFFTPTANVSDLLLNLRLLRSLEVADYSLFQSLRLYPGTPVIGSLQAEGLLGGDFPYYQANFADSEVAAIAQDIAEALDDHGDALDRQLAESKPAEGLTRFQRFLDCVEHRIAHPDVSWREQVGALLEAPLPPVGEHL